MLSFQGVVVSVHGGNNAVKSLGNVHLDKKSATFVSLLESTLRKSSIAAIDVSNVAGTIQVVVAFKSSDVSAFLLTFDTTSDGGISFLSCTCLEAQGGISGVSTADINDGALWYSSKGLICCHSLDFVSSPRTKPAQFEWFDVKNDASHILTGRVFTVVVCPPNNILILKSTPNGLVKHGSVRVDHLVDVIHNIKWADDRNCFRILATNKYSGDKDTDRCEVYASILTISLDLSVEDKYSFLVPSFSCTDACQSGKVWVIGCHNGLLYLRNGVTRSKLERQGKPAACIHISETLIFVGHTTPTLMVYSYALVPLKVFIDGVCEGLLVNVNLLLASEASGLTSIKSDESNDLICLVTKGGPITVMKMWGTLDNHSLIRTSEDCQSVELIRNAPRRTNQLKYISVLMSKAYSTNNFSTIEMILKEFTHTMIPTSGAIESAHPLTPESDLYCQLFYRYFSLLLQRSDFLLAFKVAKMLNQKDWFDELFAATVQADDVDGSNTNKALSELCISYCTEQLRRELRSDAELLFEQETLRSEMSSLKKSMKKIKKAAIAEYSVQAMEELMQKVEEGLILKGCGGDEAGIENREGDTAYNKASLILLVRLVSLYRSFEEGQTLLKKLIQTLTIKGRTNDADDLKSLLTPADLMAVLSDD